MIYPQFVRPFVKSNKNDFVDAEAICEAASRPSMRFVKPRMNQYVKRTQRDYPLSFKLAVVEQVEKGEMTYRQAQDRYGIQGRSTVLKWLRKFGQLDWLSPSPAKMYGVNMPKMPLTPEQRIKELE